MIDIRQKIAIEIFENDWLKNECMKTSGWSTCYTEDLISEVLLIILTYKNISLLKKIYNTNDHYRFIKQIILNQFNSNSSPFYTTYKKYNILKNNLEDEKTDN